MDGLELAELIAEERPETRVVLITEDGLVPKHWRSRMLIKPLEAAALRRQIEQALHELPCEAARQTAEVSEGGD